MYDVPSVGAKEDCAECKKVAAKVSELSSRYRSLLYTSEDFNRQRGEGAFKKAYPAAQKMMDTLLKEKTDLTVDHEMQHAEHELNETEEEELAEQETGVPVI